MVKFARVLVTYVKHLQVAPLLPPPPVPPFPPALMTETTVQTDVFPKSTFLFHNGAKVILDSHFLLFLQLCNYSRDFSPNLQNILDARTIVNNRENGY